MHLNAWTRRSSTVHETGGASTRDRSDVTGATRRRRTAVGTEAGAGEGAVAELRGVAKAFGARPALAGLDLVVPKGAFLALLGPNGAGKTTALSLLLGLRVPDRGEALLLGGSPLDESIRRRIGATPQVSAYPSGLKVREVVAFVAAHYPDPMPEAKLYERFGLGGLAGRQVGGLSGGEQRRLGAALALVGNPEVVFLDEPSTGLDVEVRRLLWDTVRAFHEDGGTVVLTTHYLEEAEALAERIAVIHRGRLVAEGTRREITSRITLRRVRFRAEAVPDVDPVSRSAFEAGVVTLFTPDADRLVRRLVETRVAFSDLEVLPARLEEAFVSLTREDA